ncbi:MAG TPA: LptF/LptG family permease [Ramlibacter sp.]
MKDSPKFATPRTLAFDSYDLPVSLPVLDQFRRRAAGQTDELYLHELWRLGYGGGAKTQEQKLGAQAHFNFRMVEVVMMFMLPLLAIALAVPPKRSSSGLGIFISILMVVAYHKVNQYAEAAAAQGRIEPTLALWGPLVLLSALIYWMYHVLAHRPGGQPIGALEWFFAATAKRVRNLMPKPKEA